MAGKIGPLWQRKIQVLSTVINEAMLHIKLKNIIVHTVQLPRFICMNLRPHTFTNLLDNTNIHCDGTKEDWGQVPPSFHQGRLSNSSRFDETISGFG